MKIKTVSTEQFAGIKYRKIEFGDGVNVVYGRNESGKSTLVNLISGILFQDAKIDRKTEKAFHKNAFPADKKDGGISGDTVNGIIVLDSESGEYTLTKEWRKDKKNENEAVSKLKTPDDTTLRKQEDITAALSEILGCEKGTYKEMLLSSQSSAADNLKNILDGKGETNKTLADAVSQAFVESDGISVNELENKINDDVSKLTGKWWDAERKCPAKNGYTESSRQLGEIMEALIRFEKVKDEIEKQEDLEKELNKALKDFSDKSAAVQKAAEDLSEFDKYYESLVRLSVIKDKIYTCEEDIKQFSKAIEELPKSRLNLEKANALKQEKDNRELLDRYNNAKKYHDDLQVIENKLSLISRPEDSEIAKLRGAEEEIRDLESKLRGMNIDAKIKMLGGNSVKITSLLSGKEVTLDGESARISEAVRVEIPGIMEMVLSPAETDAVLTNTKIEEQKKIRLDILDKYKCLSVKDIEQLARDYDELLHQRSLAEKDFNNAAAGSDFADLESRAEAITDVRAMSVIDSDISALCGGCDLNLFIRLRENFIEEFSKNYSSEDALKQRIESLRKELTKLQKSFDDMESIPEKYRDISDSNGYKKQLNEKVEQARKDENETLTKKAEAQKALDIFIESHGDDLSEEKERAEREYNEKVELLDKWLHIQRVFNEHKAALNSNPLESLTRNFVEYLGRISGDRVTAEFAEAGKPDFTISSGSYDLDYSKLSDGTKETVYLAFRLAVLDYLFPDGGGIIVLDDPLNDMDIDRVKQSCELIKESAQKHQIIFLTCREEYLELLGGNLIHI